MTGRAAPGEGLTRVWEHDREAHAVPVSTFIRHRGEWWLCDDPRPHAEHQLSYWPWRGCPGRRLAVEDGPPVTTQEGWS